jgi:hypothetical protein
MSAAVYLDRSSRTAVKAGERWCSELGGALQLLALESGDASGSVPEADFFAGDLAAPDGEAAGLAGYRVAGPVSLEAADRMLSENAVLAGLNDRLGRNTIRLLLAKRYWGEAWPVLARIFVARALTPSDEVARVVVARPLSLPIAVLEDVVPNVSLRWYTPEGYARAQASQTLRYVGGVFARRTRRVMDAGFRRPDEPNPRVPSVLITHDDDMVTDRTVRSQPYWLDPATPPEFRVLVMPTAASTRRAPDDELAAINVTFLTPRMLGDAWMRGRGTAPDRRLRDEARRALALAMRLTTPAAMAAAWVYQAIDFARLELAVAKALDVRCCVAADPHMVHADAMALVAEVAGIPFVSHQYSNLANVSPPMLATADEFVLFADGFEPLWNIESIRARQYTSGGYIYDAAFARVRPRSDGLRARLHAAGARTVVCYFDESVQRTKFGIINPEKHRAEVLRLVSMVLERDDWAVIVKSQFEFNSPSRLYPDDPVVAAAGRTGRYVELLIGEHRNVVFPCEAAMAADVAIGHFLGATASLEAALAGTRSVMIDEYNQVRFRRELYNGANVLFPDVDSALGAIERWRAGDPSAADVGDWAPIIDAFDPYRDGRAGERFCSLIAAHMNDKISLT